MKIKYLVSKDKRCSYINKLISKKFPHFINEENPDLILVSGGDGAMLHAIQQCAHHNVPFIGYATGTLNFIMNEIDEKDAEELIEKLENNKLSVSRVKTTKIDVELVGDDKETKQKLGSAVNDVVLGTSIMGYHGYLINSSDESFKDFEIKGSGICVSSDLGSTGYNFNLGGSVLPLGRNLWSIVGIVCNRYINDIMTISEIEITNNSIKYLPFDVFIDGIKSKIKVRNGDKVVLKKGEKVEILFLNQKTFLEKRISISSRYRKN